jgi:hypothetical protein
MAIWLSSGRAIPNLTWRVFWAARGIAGKVTILDAKTREPRTIIPDIEKAATLCTEEGPHGPRFVKRRQTRVDRPYVGGTSMAAIQGANSRSKAISASAHWLPGEA